MACRKLYEKFTDEMQLIMETSIEAIDLGRTARTTGVETRFEVDLGSSTRAEGVV